MALTYTEAPSKGWLVSLLETEPLMVVQAWIVNNVTKKSKADKNLVIRLNLEGWLVSSWEIMKRSIKKTRGIAIKAYQGYELDTTVYRTFCRKVLPKIGMERFFS